MDKEIAIGTKVDSEIWLKFKMICLKEGDKIKDRLNEVLKAEVERSE